MIVGFIIILGIRGDLLVLSAAAADGNVPERASFGPVPPASLAEVAGLGEAVVVVVAELGVGGFTARALEGLVMLGPQPPLHQGSWAC